VTARRGIGLAAIVVVAAAAVAVVLALSGGDEGGDGPLYSPDADEVTLTIRPGGRLTWGQPIYFNRSDQPIRLVSARPAELDPGLEVVGVLAAGQEREAAVGLERRFPVPDVGGRPVDQVEVAPESTPEGRDGVEFFVGLTAHDPGRYVARGLEVVYEHDGRRYRETMPDALSVCVVAPPEPRDAKDCAFPGTPPGKVE
jgi:hypothetical protein